MTGRPSETAETNENESRKSWEGGLPSFILRIISGILVPLSIAYVGYTIQRSSGERLDQEREQDKILNFQKHDSAILEQFQNLYFNNDKRYLSLRYINLIHDSQTQNELRKFVVWDILDRTLITKPNRANRSFHFDPNVLDWHTLGENVIALRKDKDGMDFYEAVKKEAPNVFKDYGTTEEVSNIFKWLELTYVIGGPTEKK